MNKLQFQFPNLLLTFSSFKNLRFYVGTLIFLLIDEVYFWKNIIIFSLQGRGNNLYFELQIQSFGFAFGLYLIEKQLLMKEKVLFRSEYVSELHQCSSYQGQIVPRIDEMLQSVKRTSFMTTSDIRSEYHQVKMHQCDRDEITFVTPFKSFRYFRMPFRLNN